jgi:hypothetical protein
MASAARRPPRKRILSSTRRATEPEASQAT